MLIQPFPQNMERKRFQVKKTFPAVMVLRDQKIIDIIHLITAG